MACIILSKTQKNNSDSSKNMLRRKHKSSKMKDRHSYYLGSMMLLLSSANHRNTKTRMMETRMNEVSVLELTGFITPFGDLSS